MVISAQLQINTPINSLNCIAHHHLSSPSSSPVDVQPENQKSLTCRKSKLPVRRKKNSLILIKPSLNNKVWVCVQHLILYPISIKPLVQKLAHSQPGQGKKFHYLSTCLLACLSSQIVGFMLEDQWRRVKKKLFLINSTVTLELLEMMFKSWWFFTHTTTTSFSFSSPPLLHGLLPFFVR